MSPARRHRRLRRLCAHQAWAADRTRLPPPGAADDGGAHPRTEKITPSWRSKPTVATSCSTTSRETSATGATPATSS